MTVAVLYVVVACRTVAFRSKVLAHPRYVLMYSLRSHPDQRAVVGSEIGLVASDEYSHFI
jgi:hypothetical protein